MLEIIIVLFVSGFVYSLLDQMKKRYSAPLSLFLLISVVGWFYGEKPKTPLEYSYVPFVEGVSALKNQVVGSNTTPSISTLPSSHPTKSLVPDDQQAVMQIVAQAARDARALRDGDGGAQRLIWIEANQKLCSPERLGFDIFDNRNGWIVTFRGSTINSTGRLLSFEVDVAQGITLSLRPHELIPNFLVSEGAIGTRLRITGRFERGDISANECLRAVRIFGGEPDIYRNRIRFNLTSIEIVN